MNSVVIGFIIEHPIIAFLIVDTICDTAKHLVKQACLILTEYWEKRYKDALEARAALKKEPIGFKCAKEES